MNIQNKIIDNLPLGYAYCQLIYDNNKPVDYIFVEVNEAFNKYFEIEKSIVGESFLNIVDEDINKKQEWLNLCFDVVLNGKTIDIDEYTELLNKKFRMRLHACDDKHFITYFFDITKEQTQINNLLLEQKLENTENELANFFNVNLDLFCIANNSGELLKVNQSWNRIMGYELDYLVGKKLFDFIHPEDIEKTNKIFEKSQNEEILSFVNRYKTITGDYIYLEWHSYPYGDNIFASARDVTKRISLENSLNVEKERLNATLFSVGEAVIGIDKDGIIYLFNDEAERILGYHHNEVIGKKINDFVKIYKENNNDECIDFVNKVLNEGKILKNKEEIYLVNKNNKRVPIQLKGNPIKNNMGAVLVISDYTESKQKILEINRLSFHDHLTGVYNRRYYEMMVNKFDKETRYPLALIMVDVNNLKMTNDAFGHIEGDKLLIRVASILKKYIKKDDILARIGGDEFVYLIPNTSLDKVQRLIKNIENKVEKERNKTNIISFSIGSAIKYNKNQKMEDVFKEAEDMMYKNKINETTNLKKRTIDVIMTSLFEKSKREMLHSARVSLISEKIAKEMDLSKEQIKNIRTAALMHDIGKISISEEVLNKEGKLTESEYEEIKTHSEIGYRILSSVSEFSNIAVVVLQHHEKMDGTGYPSRLKGSAISLDARIIAVADAYDAMTADRSYRKAMTKEAAISELIKCTGTHFDKDVVDAFIKTLK